MESVCKKESTLLTDKVKNEENQENEFLPSSLNENSDEERPNAVFSLKQTSSKYFISSKLLQEDSQRQEVKSLSSVLDTYCKSNILDESADFVHCDSLNKFKIDKNEPKVINSKKGPSRHKSQSIIKNNKTETLIPSCEKEILQCEICKQDITNLDVFNREVHVNKCIDRQISNPEEPDTQMLESPNVFILECPLCFKHFSSPELRSNHIKKCGRSKGLSLQSIIKALELQERHTLERISLGLPAKPIKPVKSNKGGSRKRPLVEPKNKAQSDIQLAKALSLSLENSNKQRDEESGANITFVTLKPPTAQQHPGKKTKKVVCTPLLVLRTEEERKKLLLDKVAAIVAPQGTRESDTPMDTENASPEKKNENLCAGTQEGDTPMDTEIASLKKENENLCEFPLLWRLSGKASEKHEYYVENLLDWIQPSDLEVGAKLCHLSQIAGHEIVTQLPCDYTFSNQETQEKNCMESSQHPDSSSSLIDSLRSLVASSWMSDVDIYTACGTVIPAHRLLLAVRCPPLKQDLDFCSKSGKVSLKWETTNFDVALQFLNFIYSGNIEIEENMKSDLLFLANKYEVSDLQTLLLSNEKSRMPPESESYENVLKNLDCKDALFPLSQKSQLETSELENNALCETQEDNMDLEIVYNCISSSLKPSQPYVARSFNAVLASPTHSEFQNNSQHSPGLNCSQSELLTNSPKKYAINHYTLPENRSSSPVIFDVNDSESDKENNSDSESVEFPVNCSQKSVSKECYLEAKDLDLCSTESNSSDSVKFLQSSFSAHNNPYKSPVKENILSKLPKFSISPLRKESPVANDVSGGLENCVVKSFKQTTEASSLNVFPTDNDEYAMLDSESPYLSSFTSSSQYPKNMQSRNEINMKESSTVNPSDTNTTINHVLEISEKDNNYHLNDEITNPHSFIAEEFNAERCKTPSKDYSDQDDLPPTPKISRFVELPLPRMNVSSPEVLICDSDCDPKSPMSIPCEEHFSAHEEDNLKNQMKFSLSSIEEESPKTSINFPEENVHEKTAKSKYEFNCQPSNSFHSAESLSSVNHEKRNVANPIVICFGSDDEDSLIVNQQSLSGKEQSELKENFSFANFPNEDVPNTEHGSPTASPTSFEHFDEPLYECYEDIQLNFSSPLKPTASSYSKLHSVNKTETAKENKNTKIATPSNSTEPQFRLTDSPITPFPDYKNMVTPDIKQALQRIGVKALPRKKALALLSHVYNETHPLVNGETANKSPEKISKAEKVKKRKNVNDAAAKPPKKKQIEVPCPETISTTQHSDAAAKLSKKKKVKVNCPETVSETQDSDDSGAENPDWLGCVPEISFLQFTQDSPSKPSKDDVNLIKKYIQSNEELYNNILTYTPLNLVSFHQELKANGMKISIQKLMEFLDEQCITFTCPRKEEYKKKQAARTQRFRKKMIAKMSQETS